MSRQSCYGTVDSTFPPCLLCVFVTSHLLPSPAFLPLSQGEGQHIPELAAEGQESLLTSIYAKIQPHSPEATGTDGNVILGHL